MTIKTSNRLTAKQERFIAEYLIDLNATQAAKRAGYSDPNIGRQLITKNNVAAAIAKGRAKQEQRAEIKADDVIRELAKIAFTDIRKAVRWGKSPVDTTSKNADPNGLNMYPVELVPSEDVDDDTAAAIAEVSLTQAGIKVKMHDKRAALVDLGRHFALFTDKAAIDVNHGVQDPDEIIARAKQAAARLGVKLPLYLLGKKGS